MSETPAIELERVGLSLGGAVIHEDLSFSVGTGELVCLLGPSGCGKSTALRLIGDLAQPTRGSVRVMGIAAREAWRQIAYVFQSPRLLPWRTALDNAAFGIEMREPATGAGERRARALAELTRVGLANDAGKMPIVLSGGERQRVALARALAVKPQILLMDEPFSALDPETRARLRAGLIEIWSTEQRTILFVTHDIDEALVLADRIIILSPKPARVVETLAIKAERPRLIEASPSLQGMRRAISGRFRQLGSEETTNAWEGRRA